MTLLVSSSHFASAEALFGSAARGDADAFSDRDVLIVDDDITTLATRSAELEAQGASVASYTFAKLAALANQGALFVQHLKLEAKITRDLGGRLAEILNKFSPRADYSSDIIDNSVLCSLAGTVSAGGRGVLLAADILYVGVRNYGVLSLAERGVHVYGFDAVIAGLEAEGLIAPGGARALSILRFLKCLYRTGEASSSAALLETVKTTLSVLPPTLFPAGIKVVAPHCIIYAPPPTAVASYVVLRDLECRFVALQALGYNINLNAELVRLSRWIGNPRSYTSISHQFAPHLYRIMKKIALECQNRSRVSS
ncbi:nucleotidyltransferase domain-containing protein [Niveispirillum irakense]|uniref:nucleotidyltransferase domain-containing protein n=1 Tax=Niveispirillum irakense TaxID=34011 RepID=UPI0012B533A6|nr:hypothetical protein [Niveispirillum irakense]